ncbi:MAG: RsmD family RNA methyltransferase, partial [Legionellaceae bacterium]|nr:RsmD family RNA methyltransferase [Legionellaceae bacterium]
MKIRIIAGRLKGKQITVPPLEIVRPTPNRVRETLFNWLMHDLVGSCCLDAFAGTGALGLEAFSRGAQEIVFIESQKKVYDSLSTTIRGLCSP